MYLVELSAARDAITATAGQTDSPEDAFMPPCHTKALTAVTAQSLREGITFKVWDEDVLDDDFVGTCHFEMSNDTFNADVLTASCDAVGLSVHFYTKAIN
ncbi:MAG: hypothetical protein IPM35_08155 [Myxococcales bacterium]|nr:hypothetical protein [Myxococcales bacterium]